MTENRTDSQNVAALTPGTDFVFNFRDDQISLGRHGNDIIFAFDPAAPTPEAPVLGEGTSDDFFYDILLGDFLDENIIGQRRFYARPEVTGVNGQDRFVLGDWRTPYYLDDFFLGTQQAAIVADFQTELDTLQLYGSRDDYFTVQFPIKITDPDTGEAKWFTGLGLFYKGLNPATNTQDIDLVAYFPNVRPFQVDVNIFGGLQAPDLDLDADYIKYMGNTPPPGPAESDIHQLGTIGVDGAFGVSVDPHGNVYVIGTATGDLAADGQGSFDFWIAKYDRHGNEKWLKQYGSSHPDFVWDIETFIADNGEVNFYVTGSTTGVISDALGGSEVNNGYQDVWIARFDSEGNPVLDSLGNPIFVRQNPQPLPGPEIDNSLQIDVDEDGNLYQSGVTVEQVIFNGEEALDDFTWLASYTPNGDLRWFNSDSLDFTGVAVAFDESYGVALAADGTTFATGFTQRGLAGEDRFVGVYDTWISRFDKDGNQIFLDQVGSINYDFAWGIDTDSESNAYIAGLTRGDFLGPDGNPVATNAGFNDVFLVKYRNNDSEDGTYQNLTYEWAVQFGTAGDDGLFLGDIVIDDNDNIFVTGFTDSNLGGANQGGYDTWVASYDTNGNRNWITQFGSTELDMPTAIDFDTFGSIYVTGYTEGSLGDLNKGAVDAWIAKLDAQTGQLIKFKSPISEPEGGDQNSNGNGQNSNGNGQNSNGNGQGVVSGSTNEQELPDQLISIVNVPERINQVELVDLRGVNNITLQFEVSRSAKYDNLLGFYAVENTEGQVRDELGALVTPGDPGYAKAALRNRVDISLKTQNRTTSVFTLTVEQGQLWAPYLITDGGTVEALLDDAKGNDPDIYFSYVGANKDGFDHVKSIATNTLGFEDLPGGGDQDFNDLTVKINILQASSSPIA